MNLSAFCASLAPRHFRNLGRLFRNHQWEQDDEGDLLIGHARISGKYETTVNGKDPVVTSNLITTEGANYLIGVGISSGITRYSTFYIAPFSGNVTVADTWTAANFASTTTELTTQYSESTRVEFVESAPASKSSSNIASPAVLTAATDNVTVYGVGLISTATKGATTGVLLSAAKYGSPGRLLSTTGDTLGVKYTLSLSNI